MRIITTFFVAVLLITPGCASVRAADRPNLLIITVDDMSADSVGVFGCQLPGTTPRMDRLAAQGLRFDYAHVQVGNCKPSRNVMWSGCYPHNNGVEGFYSVPEPSHPHLADLMRGGGYFTAIRGKVSHSTPYHPYRWDLVLDTSEDGKKLHIKDVKSYGLSTAQGIEAAQAAGKPFCVMVNISDPHKPLYAQGRKGETIPDPHVPTRVFKAKEVPVPGFLFDDPIARKELAHYYSSVRRADDAVGAILDALHASGQAERTLVMFFSDHGMPLPFAKTQLYHHSTHTPLMIRWPGVTKAGAVDRTHMVSAVDFLPTLLDVTGLSHPEGMDGRSFAPLLRGEKQDGREMVIKEYNENAGGSRDPMRAVQTKRYLYLFNPWSNGQRVFATATTGTPTYRRFAELAKTNKKLAARHRLYQNRVVEELYDVEKDPDCLVNLVQSWPHQLEMAKLQKALDAWMVKTNDHMLPVFRGRADAEVREQYVLRKEAEAAARRKKPRTRTGSSTKHKVELIRLQVPKTAAVVKAVVVTLHHKLPASLGEQLVHVTLKAGPKATRVDRKIVQVSGQGEVEVSFDVPAEVTGNTIRFAAFIGKGNASRLQHLQTKPLPLRRAPSRR